VIGGTGFATVLNYIMNYYAGTDMEVRDPRGFTALIKAGLQGRQDCVAALLMHGESSHEQLRHNIYCSHQ